MTTFDIIEHARAVILGAKEKARHESRRGLSSAALSTLLEGYLYDGLDDLDLDQFLPDVDIDALYIEATDAAEHASWMAVGS